MKFSFSLQLLNNAILKNKVSYREALLWIIRNELPKNIIIPLKRIKYTLIHSSYPFCCLITYKKATGHLTISRSEIYVKLPN